MLSRYPRLAVAVSGGVDSMTLASVAYAVLGDKLLLVHARSPAVPSDASERVEGYARRLGWPLKLVDAGEFADQRYLGNPVNRCYYCKSNLYARLRDVWDGPIASGANLDDLGDYRPGLVAAHEKSVVHPLIEASIDKRTVRALARHQQLGSVASLPAQPCLSSRVETGLAISVDDLVFLHRVERYMTDVLGPGDLRCRVTAAGIRIEVADAIKRANVDRWSAVCREVENMIAADGRELAEFSVYRRGSAFLHESEDTRDG
ncbi:MAG: adenine nucleotide alpha hydrolase [Granulosicoccus sp.]|nr:adenine nucleotide alpha hydrolase [Granulosicoccus sp.]